VLYRQCTVVLCRQCTVVLYRQCTVVLYRQCTVVLCRQCTVVLHRQCTVVLYRQCTVVLYRQCTVVLYRQCTAVCSRMNVSKILHYTVCVSRYSRDEVFYLLSFPHRLQLCVMRSLQFLSWSQNSLPTGTQRPITMFKTVTLQAHPSAKYIQWAFLFPIAPTSILIL
jgi:hypothetical protein